MTNEDDRLVSILFPCSRVDDFFDEALNSIIFQTYKNIEIIIIANGVSTDDYNYLDNISLTDERIRLIRTDIKGLTFALNLGIHNANGFYLARMDSDDISNVERIEKQVNFLNNNLDCSVVGCKIVLIDENNETLRKTFPFYERHEEIARIICVRNVMCHPALMFRKDSLISVGAYKFGFMSEDHELFIRMLNEGMKFHNLQEVLFSYRRHSSQITNIKNAWRHFFEVSSFLYMHAFLNKKVKCLAGIIVIFPPLRQMHNFLRSRFFKKGE